MKKRLISLLVALCMAVTLLPVSAITAWAEEGGSNLKPLQIWSGYPVLDGITPTTDSQNHKIYTGDGWSYDGTDKVLTLAPQSHTTYDLKDGGSIRQDQNSILCSAIIGENATIKNGAFWNTVNPGSSITNDGTITSGVYSMPVINHGTITGGTFKSTVTNNGTIKGGIFHKKPEDGQVADGYTLKVNSQQNGSYESFDTEISYFGNSGYVIPNSDHDTSITIYISLKNSQAVLFPIDVTFGDSNDTHCLFEDWAPSARYYDDGSGNFSVTFTAPPATANTVTLSKLTRLVIDENGYPVGTKGGTQGYSGNGWSYNHTDKTLTLNPSTPTSYDFSGEKNALRPLNPDVNLVVESGATLTGGAFAAGLLYNDGVITGGAFNGKDSVLNKLLGSTVVSDTALSGDYRSVTVNDGAIVKVNDTHPLVYNETTHDLVQGSAWDLYSYAGTVLTVESNVDITNINGQKIGEAFSSYYLNGETDKTVVRFEMPDSDLELNSTKIVVPDPKPEPEPDPTPETYTLTVKGGTFTYNGGEAMTSANVPVDAEVKVTLNQSAVPEGMVFDLWAMDEASLLGNPAVAYNQESFTIPAGSVAKDSTVTVEAQYRDATIESEPSILGTAAIIGVAGAGTAVIVWQGYRIGMELYEKYFQPTPEETAAEQPAPEAPAAAAS